MTTRHRKNRAPVTASPLKVAAALAFFALAFSAAKPAHAQEWLKDRRFSEGAGARVGNFEFHPGIAAEGGFDSNWFYRTFKTGANIANVGVVPAGMLRITPSLSLSTIGERRREKSDGDLELPSPVQFRAGVNATYREFFGDQTVRDQRNVSGNASMRVDFGLARPVGGDLYAGYTRSIRPSSSGVADLGFNRNEISGGGDFMLNPGGGTLDWRFGYQARGELFENTGGKGQLDSLTHEASTRGRWKFRPRTAFVYDATLRFTNYVNPVLLRNNRPLRTRIGLTGLVTPRFGVTGMVGWGASFVDTSVDNTGGQIPQFDSVIAEAELRWFLTANPAAEQSGDVSLALSYLSLGYNRDFQPSLISTFYGIDRGFVKFAYFFGGRALVSAEAGAGAIKYPNIFGSSGTAIKGGFTDVRADATLFGEYRFSDSFGINLTGKFTGNFSKNQIPADLISGVTASNPAVVDMNWMRFESFLGVRWFL